MTTLYEKSSHFRYTIRVNLYFQFAVRDDCYFASVYYEIGFTKFHEINLSKLY